MAHLSESDFRPHNRSDHVSRLYLVGASYQPGGGLPSVMISAKNDHPVDCSGLGLLA
jgi:phytoene desaturase